jgi:preprotein translocase subunit YajC
VKLSKLVLPAIAACILFIAVMVFFLIRIQRIKYRSFKYLIYALCASGLFFIAVALVALGTDYLARIGISGQGLYRLILTYATSIFDLMLWVGGGAVIVSAICASVYMYYRKQRKKAYRSA